MTLASGGSSIEVAPGDIRMPVAPWLSANGITGEAHPPVDALFGANLQLVAARGGYVAAGTLGDETGGHIWTSTDGLNWVDVAGVDLAGVDEFALVSDGCHVLLGRAATALRSGCSATGSATELGSIATCGPGAWPGFLRPEETA